MSVAGALLARCVGRDRYFEVLDAIFHAQAAMVESGDVHAGLLGVARSIGMTETRFDACISDPAAIKALDDRHRTFMVQEHISAVPTFVVNGLKLEGNQSLEQLDAAVDRALAGAAPSVRNTEPSANRASLGARGLSFRAVDKEAGADPRERPPTTGDERLPQTDGADLWLRSAAVITTAMIGSAEVDTDQMGRPSVSFRLTEQGRRRFAAFTAANVGRQFAIVWNGEVVSAPLIRSPITGPEGMIVGHFTAQAAAEMARSIASQPP